MTKFECQKRPDYVSEVEFKVLLDYSNSKEAQKTSHTNTENRKKLRYPCTIGKKSFAVIREEKKKEIVGIVSSKDFFVATPSRKPNRIYKESYGAIICKIAEMEKIQSQEIQMVPS
ncbi:hypothetical protein P3L10_030035 [Capsicum annuum]